MLKTRAFNATVWSAIDVFSRQGLQFVISITLARLLAPADYGLFGIVLLLVGVAAVFADGGFSAALIQRQDVDRVDESTVFWFNCAAGALVALLLCAAAPAIAVFYEQPQLTLLIQLMALNVLFGAFGSIHVSLLTKYLNFRVQILVGFFAVLISGLIAAWMARHGYGVWALVAQVITMNAVNTILLWMASRWRPLLTFSAASIRKLFAFGSYYFASTLIDSLYTRLYTIPVGKIHGMSVLGYYINADSIQQMPSGVLIRVFSRVAFPMFAATAHDVSKIKRGMQMAIRAMMLINVPVMLGIAVLAEPIMSAIFGRQWLPSVPILRVLCLAGVLAPIHALNLNCLMAMGHSRLVFRNELIKKVLGLILLGIGSFFGVMGVAWSIVVLSIFGLALNVRYAHLFGYGLEAQVREFLPTLAVGAVMAGLVGWLAMMWQAPDLLKITGLTVLGAVVFLSLAVLVRLDALRDVIVLFRNSRDAQEKDRPL